MEQSKVQFGDLRLTAFGKYNILDDNAFREETIINGDRGKNYALILFSPCGAAVQRGP